MSTNALESVDLLVVGGGKAGKSLAMERAKAGWKVAMVERRFVGGTCINVACIPTKSLVNSARRLNDARTDEASASSAPRVRAWTWRNSAPTRRASWGPWWPRTRRCSRPPAWISSVARLVSRASAR